MIIRLTTATFLIALLACGSENKPPPKAAADSVIEQPPPAAPAEPPPKPQPAVALKVSEDIRTACDLPEAQTYFGYNSSKLRREDEAFLKKLTRCATQGPLAKRQMRVVGHADPRGSEQYNYQLGLERADSVKTAMLGLGLPRNQVETSSRGEREARGTNAAGWARDRRVEISLVQ